MSDKEKIFGSPSDYPFSSGNTNKIEVRKRIPSHPTNKKRSTNGFQRQIKRTKYKIAKRIVGGL
jgi:hypothetical protein